MTADLTTRVTELAAQIEARLAMLDGLAQQAQPWPFDGIAGAANMYGYAGPNFGYVWAHVGQHDPARVQRRVEATRLLVAEILAEPHDWNPLDEYYSCSQARENTGTLGMEVGPPGSGCSDPDRAGQPCDCGRDQRVARLLGIIASEWEEQP